MYQILAPLFVYGIAYPDEKNESKYMRLKKRGKPKMGHQVWREPRLIFQIRTSIDPPLIESVLGLFEKKKQKPKKEKIL